MLDELHALVTSKRGDLLSLGMARLFRLAPGLTTIGLSATVREPDELRRYLVAQRPPSPRERGEGWGEGEVQDKAGKGGKRNALPRPDALRETPPHPNPLRARRERETSLADLVVVEGGASPTSAC